MRSTALRLRNLKKYCKILFKSRSLTSADGQIPHSPPLNRNFMSVQMGTRVISRPGDVDCPPQYSINTVWLLMCCQIDVMPTFI